MEQAISQTIKVYVLGEFRITRVDGSDITPTSTKARCMMIMLLLAEDGVVPRDKIARLLWSRHAREQARTSLRQCLRILKQTFQNVNPTLLSADRENIYLHKDKLWLDTDAIVSLCATVPLTPGKLLELCRGPILEDIQTNDSEFDTWLALERHSLKTLTDQCLQRSLTLAIEREQPNLTLNIEIASALLRVNPCNEFAARVLMQHYAAAEDLSSAVSLYAALENNLHDGLQAQPSAKTQSIYQAIKHHHPVTLTSLIADNILDNNGVNQLKSVGISPCRSTLLEKVKEFWIEGILEHSLFSRVIIELGLEQKADQIFQPWQGILQHPEEEPRLLPSSTSVIDLFDDVQQSLLILGAPGAGKTTLLLSLCQHLLERACNNETLPIPVVFHLSTWANSGAELDQWLVDELERRYQMSVNLATQLISQQGMVLLLDGLDEVDINARAGCVQAINLFRRNHPGAPMVVCSREKDYQALPEKLTLSAAVAIQAIQPEQLVTYLQALGSPSTGLNAMLARHKQFRELLTTPLMLSIAAIAYHDYRDSPAPIIEFSLEAHRERLYSAYTAAMFRRRQTVEHYSETQTKNWLSWMANTLAEEKQSIFYLDAAQPHWLPSKSQRLIVSMGSVMLCALSVALVLGLLGEWGAQVKYSLVISLAVGTVGGGVTALLGYGDNIKPVTHIRLSPTILRHRFPLKLMGSSLIATIFGGGVALAIDPNIGGILGVCVFVFLLVVNAINFAPDDKFKLFRAIPNGGIRYSLKLSLISTACGASLGAAIGLWAIPQGAIYVAILLGMQSGLFFGGHACIQHYLLRYFLWRNQSAPLNYVPFLEFAVNRVFLYRVGGGYLFLHRSLMEYYADKFQHNRQ